MNDEPKSAAEMKEILFLDADRLAQDAEGIKAMADIALPEHCYTKTHGEPARDALGKASGSRRSRQTRRNPTKPVKKRSRL